MKFFIAALLATTSAVSLNQLETRGGHGGPPPSAQEIAEWIMKHTDQNGDKEITWDELADALTELAEEHDHDITDEEWAAAK